MRELLMSKGYKESDFSTYHYFQNYHKLTTSESLGLGADLRNILSVEEGYNGNGHKSERKALCGN